MDKAGNTFNLDEISNIIESSLAVETMTRGKKAKSSPKLKTALEIQELMEFSLLILKGFGLFLTSKELAENSTKRIKDMIERVKAGHHDQDLLDIHDRTRTS